jgi:hypothetical protein
MVELLSSIVALFRFDERFIMHRFYSSRLALAVGMALIAAWLIYGLLANHQVRYDLAIIGGVMALTKVVAMVYYRIAH